MLKEIKINMDTCNHCKTCTDVCYTNVIGWDDERRIPYAAYPLDCQICCVCEAACPQSAITVVPDWGKKYYPPYISTKMGGKSNDNQDYEKNGII